MKKHIPNIITLFNLLCGCVAVVLAANDQLAWAAYFAFMGIFFDFFDGLAARALGVKTDLGKQLDSLADMVTSGLVPGFVMFQLLNNINLEGDLLAKGSLYNKLLPFLGFLITLASAYRLAKFNIDERQTDAFIGLPTPANSLLILSLPLILNFQASDWIKAFILDKRVLIAFVFISGFLLNAPVRLFALKFKNWSFTDNYLRYIFIGIGVVLLLGFKFLAIPLIVFIYITISLLYKEK